MTEQAIPGNPVPSTAPSNETASPMRGLFGSLMLCLLVDMLGYSLTLPLLPTITQTYTSSDIIVGVITSANAVFSMIFGPIWGKLSDKYGRRRILFISQVGTFSAFITLAMSSSIEMILFARILDGVFGGQHVVILAIVSDITTPENRAEKISKLMVFASLASLIGPLLGGVLGAINWRIPPMVTSAMSIISMILTTKLLVETMPRERRAELRKQREAAGISGASSRRLTKLAWMRLGQVFLISAVFTAFTSSMALVVGTRYHEGPIMIGILLSLMFVMLAVLGGALIMPLRKKFGDRKLAFASAGSGAIAWIVFILSANIWLFVVFLALLVFYQAIIQPLLKSNLTKTVEKDQQGEISGWTVTVQSIAQSVVPIIATGFIELGQLVILGVILESYAMIGLFCVSLLAVLVIMLIKDMKHDPAAFTFNPTDTDRHHHRHGRQRQDVTNESTLQ